MKLNLLNSTSLSLNYKQEHEAVGKAWLGIITSIFLAVSLQYEWLRAGTLYGNLTHDAVLAFIVQICILGQQTD